MFLPGKVSFHRDIMDFDLIWMLIILDVLQSLLIRIHCRFLWGHNQHISWI